MPSRPAPQSQSVGIPELVPPRPTARDKRPCRVDPKHFALATRIRSFVKTQGTYPSAQRVHWADALARMDRQLAKHNVTWGEIEVVWNWYAATYPTAPKGLPALANATQFRERWDWLLREMLRRGGRLLPLVITEEGDAAVAEVAALPWCEGVTGMVESVQRSLDTVRAFIGSLSAATIPVDLRFVRETVLDEIGAPRPCVELYFKRVHMRKNGWAQWNGDLTRLVWGLEQLDVTERFTDAVRRYTGSDHAWDRLTKLLNVKGKP